MPAGAHAAVSTPRPRHGEPQPAPAPSASEPASARRDLTSWWKQFSKRGAVKKEEEKEPEVRGIFGVPLITSIPYANVAISLFHETGESYIYGYVPIVVAKCGVFLKEKATDVEGIFRLAGSEKRIKELKVAFDTPPRWGKGLDWTGYTVHDAANILRRYFNQLPEPIIPLQHYDPFREPLRNHQAEAVGHIEGQAPSVGGFDPNSAVRIYQHRIKELPSLNRQLLLYILDLLAVFAAKSDVNKMTTSNLAAIFQPGILSHPQHDMSPQDYRLSQDVLIFLIDNQDHFLIGMEGTAVDEGTVKHVESGPSTPQARTPTTPGRSKSGIGRSASTASSAGAESLRKYGGVRRNVSTSSRQSRHSGAVPSPTTPAFSTTSGSGVHRSNTLPSNRSPALTASRFVKTSENPSRAGEDSKLHPLSALENAAADATQPKALIESEKIDVVRPSPSEGIEEVPSKGTAPAPTIASADPPNANVATSTTAALETAPLASETAPQPEFVAPVPVHPFPVLPVGTPTFEGMPGAFPPPTPAVPPPTSRDEVNPFAAQHSAAASGSGTQTLGAPMSSPAGRRSPLTTPKHEKSEFVEGSIDAALTPEPSQKPQRTFTQILSGVSLPSDEKQGGRRPNKLQKKSRVPSGAISSAHSSMHSLTGAGVQDQPPSPLPQPAMPQYQPTSSKEVLGSYPGDPNSSRNSGVTLKPSMSPSASFRSHSTTTEYSENEQAEDSHKEERRIFWKNHRHNEGKATPTANHTDLHGSVPGGDKSMSSFGSSSRGGRRSLQHDSHQGSEASVLYNALAESKEPEKKSHFGWFKRHDKERADRKYRAQSPPGASSELTTPQALVPPKDAAGERGRSMDVPRTATSEESSDVTPTGTSPNPLATPTAHEAEPAHQSTGAAPQSTSEAAPETAPDATPEAAPAVAASASDPASTSASVSASVTVPATHSPVPKPQASPSLQPHYRSLIPDDDAEPRSPTTPTARRPA